LVKGGLGEGGWKVIGDLIRWVGNPIPGWFPLNLIGCGGLLIGRFKDQYFGGLALS